MTIPLVYFKALLKIKKKHVTNIFSIRASINVRLTTNAELSFKNAFTSFIFLSLNMNTALEFNLMVGANTLYFCVEKIHEMALWRPLVNNPCNKL